MSNTKHTPGPWEVKHSESKSAFNIVGTQLGGKYKLARVPYLVDDRLGELNDTWKQEAEADAKLIAAAPELLENLIRILDRIKENDLQSMFPSAFDRAGLALKKATE